MSQVRFIGEQLGGLARVFGKLRFAFKSACRLRATRQAIAVRVSTVTPDLCGCSTMLSSSAKPGSIGGSFQNTSSHDAVRVHAWARLDTDRAPEIRRAHVVSSCQIALLLLPVTVSNAYRDVQNKRDTREEGSHARSVACFLVRSATGRGASSCCS